MELEDLLVMEVPARQLKYICSNNKLKPSGTSNEAFAKCISATKELNLAAKGLIDEYRFAGKTTVRLYKSLYELPDHLKGSTQFEKYLLQKFGKELFASGIKPTPTDAPQLFNVVKYDDKYFLSFVYLGKEKRVYRNYEIVKEKSQNVDFLVVHFNPFILQMRVPLNKDAMFKQAFQNVLGYNIASWANLTALNSDEISELRKVLSCGLTSAKHQMSEGIYATVEVKARPNVDLADEEEYQKQYSDEPIQSANLVFSFTHFNGLKETVSFRVTLDGINFYTDVSEEIIQSVINRILDIKMTKKDFVANASGE